MPLSKSIDGLKRLIESHHVDRLQVGDCGVQGGVALYDLINCVQRIGLHSKSIARHEIKRLSRETSEDPFHGNMVDKSEDPYPHYVPVGTIRVFRDGDGWSEETVWPISNTFNATKPAANSTLKSIYSMPE